MPRELSLVLLFCIWIWAALFNLLAKKKTIQDAIVEPAREELIFRGPLLILFASGFTTAALIGIGISALLFTLYHTIMDTEGMRRAPFVALAACGGIFFAALTVWTRSIWPAFSLHALANFISFDLPGRSKPSH